VQGSGIGTSFADQLPNFPATFGAVQEHYPDLVATVTHMFPYLAPVETLRIVWLVTGCCHHCYQAGGECFCSRDD